VRRCENCPCGILAANVIPKLARKRAGASVLRASARHRFIAAPFDRWSIVLELFDFQLVLWSGQPSLTPIASPTRWFTRTRPASLAELDLSCSSAASA
jgi:hypothetical protein